MDLAARFDPFSTESDSIMEWSLDSGVEHAECSNWQALGDMEMIPGLDCIDLMLVLRSTSTVGESSTALLHSLH